MPSKPTANHMWWAYDTKTFIDTCVLAGNQMGALQTLHFSSFFSFFNFMSFLIAFLFYKPGVCKTLIPPVLWPRNLLKCTRNGWNGNRKPLQIRCIFGGVARFTWLLWHVISLLALYNAGKRLVVHPRTHRKWCLDQIMADLLRRIDKPATFDRSGYGHLANIFQPYNGKCAKCGFRNKFFFPAGLRSGRTYRFEA